MFDNNYDYCKVILLLEPQRQVCGQKRILLIDLIHTLYSSGGLHRISKSRWQSIGSFVMMATCDRIEDRQFCYSSIDAGPSEQGRGMGLSTIHVLTDALTLFQSRGRLRPPYPLVLAEKMCLKLSCQRLCKPWQVQDTLGHWWLVR